MLLTSACGSASGGPDAARLTGASTSAAPAPAAPSPTTTAAERHHEKRPDPRWHFYTSDHHWYSSPWFHGVHRIMIGFGCNASPWYDHDPSCPGRQGFHHGIDVAMPCGTKLRAGHAGTVLSRSAPGTPGPAYGVDPVRLRTKGPRGPHDLLIGHTRTVYVHPGQHVRKGQLIARASDSGAPDGCHLHFEVRPVGGGYTTAIDPARWLRLKRT
jgi:murein DD-endopeptidase MepM/ murein hydrolase activator NlpD